MPSKPMALLLIILSLACTALGALALASAAALSGCSMDTPDAAHVEPEWRLVPEGTALAQRRQFFLYGRHLDSVNLTAPPSVTVEKGELKSGGRALSLYLTVRPLAKGSGGETPGARELAIKTPDTALSFRLKIVDEIVTR
jgi:hypothetical protein